MTAEMMLRKIYEYKVDILAKQQEIHDLEDKIIELSKDAYDIIPNGEMHLFNLRNSTAIVEIKTDTIHMLPNETDLNIINKDREFWKNAVKITLSDNIIGQQKSTIVDDQVREIAALNLKLAEKDVEIDSQRASINALLEDNIATQNIPLGQTRITVPRTVT